MNTPMSFNIHDVALMLPEAFLLGAICAILLVDLFLKPTQRAVTHWLSLAAVLGTIALIVVDAEPAATAFNGMYIHDGVAAVLRIFVLGTTGTVFVYARGYLQDRG
ncbi:MAG TPA: NADH:ubiquinone oxidoreductase subunit N, partial [Rhodanobacteraceae bacterium]|nr:NADH:ubiquinone oxidoreductase subunit N [Rhodanobacteraceae bacterium]